MRSLTGVPPRAGPGTSDTIGSSSVRSRAPSASSANAVTSTTGCSAAASIAAARPAPPGRARSAVTSSTGTGASGHIRSVRPSTSTSSNVSPSTTTGLMTRPPNGSGSAARIRSTIAVVEWSDR